ncbi:Alpha-L-arabinofuranosidase [Orobanche gracilis]
MGSYMNFKNFGGTFQPEQSTAGNFPLGRQSSIYSLTFDEFQNTLGGSGKDFGSMNMEDLLKSIWTAEGNQDLQSSTGVGNANVPGGNLQRKGSLTFPRTVSQKTVDEVWKDVLKETIGLNNVDSSLNQREPTLGEMTLEDFLAKAGVVREEVQPSGRPNGNYFCGTSNGNNIGFQQLSQNHGVSANQQEENNNTVLNLHNLGINVSGASVPSSQPQPQPQLQLQPIFPKQTAISFSSPTQIGNSDGTSCQRPKGPILATPDALNSSMVQGCPIVMNGLNGGSVVAEGYNLCTDDVIKSCTDTPPLVSPLSYNYGEVGRSRKSNSSLDKVVDRRRRRMIKNRESAARSRARKQAYTFELESEVVMLKKANAELRTKQAEFMEMQKNQAPGDDE